MLDPKGRNQAGFCNLASPMGQVRYGVVTRLDLAGSSTHEHLLEAFASESCNSMRHLWFAQQADVEGKPEAAAMFRSAAGVATSHAHGLLEFLAEISGDEHGERFGDTDDHLVIASTASEQAGSQRYVEFATTARDEGFPSVADWFDTLAESELRFSETLRPTVDQAES